MWIGYTRRVQLSQLRDGSFETGSMMDSQAAVRMPYRKGLSQSSIKIRASAVSPLKVQGWIGSRRRRNPSSSTMTIAPLSSSAAHSDITKKRRVFTAAGV
jgi:hypothetical protein